MISLRVFFPQSNNTRVLRFSLDIPVRDIIADIQEKTSMGGQDHGIFQPPVPGQKKGRWFKENHTLKFYELRTDTDVHYKKKHRNLKVKALDESIKTVLIDDSAYVGEIVAIVANKMNINNPDEYGLRPVGSQDNAWLNDKQGLHEQDVTEDMTLLFGKKLFFTDSQLDLSDQVQVNQLYTECKERVLSGKYPTTKEEARDLAALQVQVEKGNFNPSGRAKLKLEDYLPRQYAKEKSLENDILNENKKLVGMSDLNAKYRYVTLVRGLKTYGISFFEVKERGKKRGKLVTTLIGITREKILRMDFETKEVIQEYPLIHLKQWAAAKDTFTFDFGDHLDAYYTVQTPEASQISQLIAGYIDIIIKNRQNAVKTLGPDGEGNIAEISDSLPIQVGYSSVQSSGQNLGPNTGGLQKGGNVGGPLMGQQQTGSNIPESQKVQIRDIKSGKRVADLLAKELGEDAKLGGRNPSQNLGKGGLSDQQWGEQLQRANKDALNSLGALMNAALVDPNNFNKNLLDEAAKNLGNELNKLALVAKGAAQNRDGVTMKAILEAAKKSALAVAEILDLSERIANNPYDDKAKEQLKIAERAFRDAQILLQNAQMGRLNDGAAEELIGESAKSLCKNVDDVVQNSIEAVKKLNDGQKMRDIVKVTKEVLGAKDALQSSVNTLASSVLDPEAKKTIIDSSNSLAGLIAGLCSSVKNSGAPPQFLQSIGFAAKGVNDSILQLVNALDCAEEKGFDEILDFNGPVERVTTSLAEMRLAGNDKQKLLDAVKMIALASNELVAASKLVAETDPEAKDRILNSTNQTADNIKRMVESAKNVATNPENVKARQDLMESANRVQGSVQELVVNAGKTAAVVNLRAASKLAASTAIGLLSTAKDCLNFIDNPQNKQKLTDDSGNTITANGQLIEAIKGASKNPDNIEFQNKLFDTSTGVITTLANLVATSKMSSFNVTDPNKKQNLQYAANEMGDRLKDLMNACDNFNNFEGHKEIDEALQQFDAINSQIEAAEFRANSGLLKPLPGQSRDASLALLDKSFKNLSDATKNVILSAKGEGGSLGNAAKKSADTSSLVANAIEQVASTTPLQAQQKKILGSAKKLNKDIANFISASRAMNSKKGDKNTVEQGINKAYQQLKSSIASVLANTSGLDSSELDEASNNILSAANKLTVSANPLMSYSEATDSMISDIKALTAACSQLAGLAKTNPSALANASKILSQTCDDIVNKASQASSHVDGVKGQEIITGTQNLLGKVSDLLQAAKVSVASKTPESYQTLDKTVMDVASLVSELEGIVSNTQNPQIQFATNEILNALALMGDLSNVVGKDMGQVVQEIQKSAGNLAGNSSRLARASRVGTDKLGIYVKETANDVKNIIDTVKSAQKSPQSGSTGNNSSQQISPEALAIREAVQSIIKNPTDNPKIVQATKTIAQSTAGLMQQAKEISTNPSVDKNKKEAILKSARNLATSTSDLARYAKAPKDQQGINNLIKAANDLLNNTMQYENAKTGGNNPPSRTTSSTGSSIPTNATNQLVSAAKVLASAANNFLTSVGQVSTNPKDNSAINQLNATSKQYADAIRDMYNTTQLLNPGVIKIKNAEKEIEKSIADLDQAAVEILAGNVPSNTGGKSFPQCQESLVNLCKNFASDINNLVGVVSQGPEKISEVSQQISDHIKDLVLITKSTAATTTDQNLLNSLLTSAKLLSEAMGSLIGECVRPEPNQDQIVSKSKDASNIIGDLVSAVKANFVVFKDLDSTIDNVNKAKSALDQNPTPSNKRYNAIKDEVIQSVKNINNSASNLNSSDKNNAGQVGLSAKELGDSTIPFINLTKEAIGTTTDNQAKLAIKNAAKNCVATIQQLMNTAKNIGNNPRDQNAQNALTETYRSLIRNNIPEYLQAIKTGDVSSKLLDQGVAKIVDATNLLNTNFFFAKSGQMEKNKDNKTPLTQLITQLINSANQLSTSTAKLGNAKNLTPENLATLVNEIGLATEQLANQTVLVASKTADSKSQQDILASSQAVAITTQQLVLASQDVNKNPNDTTALQTHQNALSTSGTAITDMISVVQASAAEARRGEIELEKTANQIKLVLTQAIQDPNASILNVVNGARKATEGIASLVFASSQEDIVNGAKISDEAIKLILSNISAKAPNKDIQKQLLEAAQNASRAMVELLNSVKGDRENPQVKAAIQNKADDLTGLLNDLVGVCNKYPEARDASLVEDNLELKAEQQLLAAIDLIKKAAQELALAPVNDPNKKKTGLGQLVGLTLDEGQMASNLISTAREVVNSASSLMESAVVAQNERKVQNANNMKYKKDPTWANGLISSSKNVAGCVMMLVRACNAAVKGDLEEEAIIALSGSVASSTAQLVTASRVRADPNSRAQKNLDGCAKNVAVSTDKMVNAAKRMTEANEGNEDILPTNSNIINKLEQQMSILRLEKQLEQARKNLGKINKDDYTKN